MQDKGGVNLTAGFGVAVREYQIDVGSADYVLFVDRKPVDISKAKPDEEGHKLTVVENHSKAYAGSNKKSTSFEVL